MIFLDGREGFDSSPTSAQGGAEGANAEAKQSAPEPEKPEVTEAQAEEAFEVSLASVMFASFQSAFGEPPEGASLSDDKKVLTLDNMELTEFEGTAYSAISGTAANNGDGMDCDLTLADGPVKTITYSIADFQSETVEATVTVNGEPMDLVLSEDTFASQ